MPTQSIATDNTLNDSVAKKLEKNLTELLLSGGYLPHQQFLSQLDISRRYNVHNNTAKRILERLEKKKMLYRVPRKGSFVSPQVRYRQLLIISTVPENALNGKDSPGFLDFMSGVSLELNAKDSCGVFITLPAESFLNLLPELGQVYPDLAGIIFFRDIAPLEKSRRVLEERDIPFAFYGSSFYLPRLEGVLRLLYSEEQIVNLAAKAALKRGNKHYLSLYDPQYPLQQYRAELFEKEISNANKKALPSLAISVHWRSPDERSAEMKKIIEKHKPGTTYYCTDDLIAHILVNELTLAGIKIPQDAAVIGTNNYPLAHSAIVPITTVSIPVQEDARKIVSVLFRNETASLNSHLDVIFRRSL